MNITPRSIAARLVLVGTVAASAAAFVPGIAGAQGLPVKACAGKTLTATANYQTLTGTNCDDTFNIGRYAGVTVKALGGNDTVNAGFEGNFGMNYLYLGDGADRVVNSHDKPVWVDAGAGNDTIEGSSKFDTIYGGTGTDKAEVNPGDFYDSIEIFI